ncbi:hypothetical protein DY000_02009802 [Brassica cretica]|uniref:Uncharacterized protein n=1 Tax=Brassica cretica TaxID=69181 RepID=A0ABQ7BYI6_BRACR|nr:hypothetical protein DY000_02009802 [Brassica cretica]
MGSGRNSAQNAKPVTFAKENSDEQSCLENQETQMYSSHLTKSTASSLPPMDKDDRISLLETQMAAQQAGYEAQRRLNQQMMEMMQRMYPNEVFPDVPDP